MIDLETLIKLADYKITGGEEYQWKCFGPNARYIDFETNPSEVSFSIIFDTKTQEVYEATVCDYKKENCYRIINPSCKDDYQYEADYRNCNHMQAYDDVNYIDLDVDEDFIEKATAILNDEPYDERVVISVELPQDVIYILMQNAHNEDITLNHYMEKIFAAALEKHKTA